MHATRQRCVRGGGDRGQVALRPELVTHAPPHGEIGDAASEHDLLEWLAGCAVDIGFNTVIASTALERIVGDCCTE